MARLSRILVILAVAGTVAGAAGFVAFANMVRELSPAISPKADAIVVLTGDDERITAGMHLFMSGRARRLLISGVHPSTRIPAELKRYIRSGDKNDESVLKCCVDIGRDAVNTSGNADEARQWALGFGFRSLIVVTSSYHMPRSLLEFQRAMPSVKLVPYPVAGGRHVRLDDWWRHEPTARLLLGEYVKFLGATARSVVARVLLPRPSAPAEGAQPAISARTMP